MTDAADRTGDGTCIDPRRFRDTLGCFATGVAVVTTIAPDGLPVGMTISSFNSVSMEPPLVLWSISNTAPSFEAFEKNPHFNVNILSEDQHDLCLQFSRPSEDKFSGVDHDACPNGVPRLADVAARLECETHSRIEGGDHTIIIGRVLGLHASESPPLLFHRGKLRGFAQSL